jgi:hypothetical protein
MRSKKKEKQLKFFVVVRSDRILNPNSFFFQFVFPPIFSSVPFIPLFIFFFPKLSRRSVIRLKHFEKNWGFWIRQMFHQFFLDNLYTCYQHETKTKERKRVIRFEFPFWIFYTLSRHRQATTTAAAYRMGSFVKMLAWLCEWTLFHRQFPFGLAIHIFPHLSFQPNTLNRVKQEQEEKTEMKCEKEWIACVCVCANNIIFPTSLFDQTPSLFLILRGEKEAYKFFSRFVMWKANDGGRRKIIDEWGKQCWEKMQAAFFSSMLQIVFVCNKSQIGWLCILLWTWTFIFRALGCALLPY